MADGPPVQKRHSDLSGRMSAPGKNGKRFHLHFENVASFFKQYYICRFFFLPDLGPPVTTLINCGPRTSSPSTAVLDGIVSGEVSISLGEMTYCTETLFCYLIYAISCLTYVSISIYLSPHLYIAGVQYLIKAKSYQRA